MKKLGVALARKEIIRSKRITKDSTVCRFSVVSGGVTTPQLCYFPQRSRWASSAADRSTHREAGVASDVSVVEDIRSLARQELADGSINIDCLTATTVSWLQKESSGWSSRRNAAMGRNLLERWISAASISNGDDDITAARFATLILKRLLNQRELCDKDNSETRLIMELFYRVLHLWQRSPSMQSPEKSVRLFQTFHTYSELSNEPRLRPGPRAYSMVLETLRRAADQAWTHETADQLIQQLHQSQGSSPDAVKAQNSYLQFLAKCGGDAPEKAERFLRDNMMTTTKDAKSYAAVLQAWANSGKPDRACALLEEMMKLGIVNQVCFNICLRALGSAGHGQRAEEMLWRMHYLYKEGNKDARPDAYSYLAVINAWAKHNSPDKATTVLEHMLQNGDVLPTSAIYTAVMDAWSRRRNSGPQVETLLHRMEELYAQSGEARPCRKAYTVAIRAWGGTDVIDAPDRATEILRQMDALSKVSGREDLAPCTIAYTSLIHAWARSSRSDAPQRALTILRHMEKVHLETGHSRVVPDAVAFNTVLSAFARQGKADEARSLLDTAKSRAFRVGGSHVRVRPDSISWATVMHAFSKGRRSDSGVQANLLLHELEDLYHATGDFSLKPTPRIYAAVILAHSSNPDAAEAVLWRMVDSYRASCKSADSPNTHVCNALLHVWSHCDDPVAPQRAESILRWMEDQVKCERALNVHPDRASFNYVLQAWEQSKRRNAFVHIERIQLEIKSNYPHLQTR